MRNYRCMLGACAAMACLLATAPAAVAEKYSSINDAAAAGDPAASAQSGGGPDAKWAHHGKTITPTYASTHGLVCNETDAPVTECYDTDTQADRALASAASAKASSAKSSRRSKRATASCSRLSGSSWNFGGDPGGLTVRR